MSYPRPFPRPIVRRRSNVFGGVALVFAIVVVLFVAVEQLLTAFVFLTAVTVNDAVAYPSVEAMYAAHYSTDAWVITGIVVLVPSALAVVFGSLGLRRPRAALAGIALGVGVLGAITAIVGMALSPMLAAAIASASTSGWSPS